MTKAKTTTRTPAKSATVEVDPRDDNDSKFEDAPAPKPVPRVLPEDVPVAQPVAQPVNQREAVHTLPQTPNPGNPSAITGTAVPLSTANTPDVGATGDMTGTAAARREMDRDIDRDTDRS